MDYSRVLKGATVYTKSFHLQMQCSCVLHVKQNKPGQAHPQWPWGAGATEQAGFRIQD